ncbi:hypothetical protein [Sphingobium sp. DN12]|uniref:hypothetical protein n=1 Tax=Sphingobium sp. DN12 TaxID=3378073 RepID=UPI003DA5257B
MAAGCCGGSADNSKKLTDRAWRQVLWIDRIGVEVICRAGCALPPLPDDQVQREADRQEDMAAMRATVCPLERRKAMEKGKLAQILARIEAALDHAPERESQNHSQPLMDSFIEENQQSWPSRPTHQRPTAHQ